MHTLTARLDETLFQATQEQAKTMSQIYHALTDILKP